MQDQTEEQAYSQTITPSAAYTYDTFDFVSKHAARRKARRRQMLTGTSHLKVTWLAQIN